MRVMSSSGISVGQQVLGVLAYLGPLSFIPLLIASPAPFARFHTSQGIALLVVEIFCAVLTVIPVLGVVIGIVGGLAAALLSVLGLVQVFQKRQVPLPLVGELKLIR